MRTLHGVERLSRKGPACRVGGASWAGLDGVVGYSFVTADRDQVFLLPPDVREWLPEDHLAWTVLDAVGQLDLGGFRRRYRSDGHGRPAYDPALMVGVLLFAYCDGVRSSRQIEIRCERDVAYRVVAGNQKPDHATIARFRDRHRAELGGLFVQVLRLCAKAGMVKVGLVAVDGSKMAGNAGSSANRTREQLETEIADQVESVIDRAQAVDAAEDAAHGAERGDEPPPKLRGRRRRLARFREAKARLDAEAEAAQKAQDERRAKWEAARAKGGKVGGPPGRKPPKSKQRSPRANTTDPDSRVMKKSQGFCQGYNGQLVTTSGQIIVAADLICTSPDNAALHPMLDQTRHNLDAAGISEPIRAVVADSGYGGKTNLTTNRPTGCDPILLVSVNSGRHRDHTKPFKHPALQTMANRLKHPAGKRLYARRKWMIEPVFGQIKNRLGDRLHHRGHAKATTEWKMIATSHNLLKYWRHHTTQPAT